MTNEQNNLHQLVMGDVARIGQSTQKRFAKRVVEEINHALLEAGLLGLRRRFILEKIRADLEVNYAEKAEQLEGLSSKEKYALIEPHYLSQMLDGDQANEICDFWLELLEQGEFEVPYGLPAALGQHLVKHDAKWAEEHLKPETEQGNMLTNHALLLGVLKRCELI